MRYKNKNKLLSVILVTTLGIFISAAKVQAQHETDPNLVHALHQATYNTDDQSLDLELLMWLSTMSERLKYHIPNPFYRVRLLKHVFTEARAANLDPQLVLAVIDVESGFDRYALSTAGAQGLMQVMPFWKDVLNGPDDDLYNPLTNLRYGCRILRHYIDRFDDLNKALAAYNGSLGRNTYVKKIFARLDYRWQYQPDYFDRDGDTELALR